MLFADIPYTISSPVEVENNSLHELQMGVVPSFDGSTIGYWQTVVAEDNWVLVNIELFINSFIR